MNMNRAVLIVIGETLHPSHFWMYQHSPHRFFYLLIQNSQFSCELKKKKISACVLFNLYVCLAFAINTLHECQACQTQTKLNSLIKLASPSRITTSWSAEQPLFNLVVHHITHCHHIRTILFVLELGSLFRSNSSNCQFKTHIFLHDLPNLNCCIASACFMIDQCDLQIILTKAIMIN